MNSFITVSQVYGTPDELSYIDLVVLVSKEDKDFLFSKSECKSKLMFGNLNLIALDKDYEPDIKKYTAWKAGTVYLKSIKPVTREFAIEYFKSLGIEKKDYNDTLDQSMVEFFNSAENLTTINMNNQPLITIGNDNSVRVNLPSSNIISDDTPF